MKVPHKILSKILKGMALALLLSILQSCTDSGIEPLAEHLPTMKGFSYTSFAADGFRKGKDSHALAELHNQTACDYVALNVFEYQQSATSTHIEATATTSAEVDIRIAVQDARSNGMKILLKPNVDIMGGEWRANIQPDATGEWFVSYTSMILRYARLAEELQVEVLSVGCELVAATQPEHTARWRTLIAEVRKVYSGKLLYCANWSGNSALNLNTPEYQSLGFWDALDYIGIDAYYPLTDSPSSPKPSQSDAIKRMRSYTDPIGALAQRYNKKVVFSECGIQSVRGALASPWDYSLGNAPNAMEDTDIQNFYYGIFIDAAGKQPWCEGIFWWNWESVASDAEPTNYTVRNKTAAGLLKTWYTRII